MNRLNAGIIAEICLYILLILLILFIPFRLIRFLFSGVFLFRLTALLLMTFLPRSLEIVFPERPHYATLHRAFEQEVVIKNRGPLPLPFFLLEAKTNGLEILGIPVTVQALNGFGTTTIRFRIVGDKRGIHQFGPFTLKGCDPLHLFSWQINIEQKRKVIIYPSLFGFTIPVNQGLTGGDLPVRNPIFEDVTRFQALRKYQSGDELKRINWKASARMGELYSNIYDSSLYFPVLIILNLSEQDYPLSLRMDLVEKAVATAGSLAIHFLGVKQNVGLIHSGRLEKQESPRWISPGIGQQQSSMILEELAGVRSNPEGIGLRSLLKHPQAIGARGTKYLLITPPPLSEDLLLIREQRRLGMDLELYLISGLHSHRQGLSHPGIPCTVIHPMGGSPIREA